MTYRLAKTEDIPQINALCEKHGLDHPAFGMCFVAEDEGKVVGYCNALAVSLVDAASDNPLAVRPLFDMVQGGLTASGVKFMGAITRQPRIETILCKLGMKKVKDPEVLYMKELQ